MIKPTQEELDILVSYLEMDGLKPTTEETEYDYIGIFEAGPEIVSKWLFYTPHGSKIILDYYVSRLFVDLYNSNAFKWIALAGLATIVTGIVMSII